MEWLGAVPAHWAFTPIKHLALLNPRKSDFAGDTEQLCSFVPMEKLKTGVVQLDEERPIEEVIGGYTYFEDGDVLQAKVTPCFENKNVAIAKGLTNGIGFGSSEINVLRPYQGVNAEYLYYRVQEDSYMSFCTSSMIGAGGLKRVPTDVINNFKIAAPTLCEQTQIARFLDHETARIDALIEEQQRLIELLKEKRQAVISHAVTKGLDPKVPMKDSGVEWLGEVPAHWQVKRLKHLVPSITVGIVVEPSKYYVDDGVPALRSLNVKPGAVVTENLVYLSEESNELHAKSKIFEGDIVAVRSGQPGTAAIVPKEFNGANCIDLIVIRKPLQGCSTFIFWYLNSDAALKQFSEGSSGAIQQHFNIAAASEMIFAWPPASEQLEINSHLDRACHQLDRLISVAGESKSLLLERRSALISAAVTGKIDVRGWQPPANTQAPEIAVAEAN
ncbi:restriction endonuclease subunit S [Pseudomonas aeruginosa]|uniref:restriction endonuclease subunit S n=1 Tax=Pseudomonas aeruginosa TaxID=287 RepID=UPI003CC650FE